MKNINNYKSKKYNNIKEYEMIEEDIYKTRSTNKVSYGDIIYVTSLSIEQEATDDEEENKMIPGIIAQYPLEDILDKYKCWISDYYDKLNKDTFPIFQLEFAAYDINDIRNLREIIGKHVYNKITEDDNVDLIIE